ncbi:hypothetical protein [Aeromicrobium sp. Leaf350]|uniref:hypothetical protein n=1 Tax=Aeromicrobium sp. Leaf350 TaxID=2876565 RepID=UPI001E5788AA|nr:hypothetical protein [Aeromicrobium sp. Leaf350]
MTRYCIDPATLLHLARSGQRAHPSHQLVAPSALRTQALTLLLPLAADGELDDRAVLELHTAMTEIKVRLLGDRVSRRGAWQIAREHGLEDLRLAEYLAVTRLQADALVTTDAELLTLADGVVPLADTAALIRP